MYLAQPKGQGKAIKVLKTAGRNKLNKIEIEIFILAYFLCLELRLTKII